MKRYVANIVTSQFVCNALDEDSAERKYDAYFNDEDCGCEAEGLECICDTQEDVFHDWEVI